MIIVSDSGPLGVRSKKLLEELGGRLYRADDQAIARSRRGDVEQLAFGLEHFIQFVVVSDLLETSLLRQYAGARRESVVLRCGRRREEDVLAPPNRERDAWARLASDERESSAAAHRCSRSPGAL